MARESWMLPLNCMKRMCILLRLYVWIFSLLYIYILMSCDSDQQKTNNECGVLNEFMIVRARFESINLSIAADSIFFFVFLLLVFS